MLFYEKSDKKFNTIKIPVWITDILINDAPETYIKFYLMLLKLSAEKADSLTTRELLDNPDFDVYSINEAIDYLKSYGIIEIDNNGNLILDIARPKTITKPLESERPPTYTATEISYNIKKNQELSQMFALVQKMLGKTLSTSSTSTLFSFYDWLGLSPEVILALFEYCISINKKSMRYIEKVALSWHEMGITTLDEATKYIKTQSRYNKYEYMIKKAFGIYERKLTTKEESYIQIWYEQLKFSPDVASLAYEHCVNNTGKLSFAYINGILQAWHKEGIKNTEDVKNRTNTKNNNQTVSKKQYRVYNSDQYDFDEIERIAAQKLKSISAKEGN